MAITATNPNTGEKVLLLRGKWVPFNEQEFENWYSDISKKTGLNKNPDAPEQLYDYRSAFAAGEKPDETMHWPSEFKDQKHPNRYVDGIDTITGQKARTATNKDTGERLVFHEGLNEWVPYKNIERKTETEKEGVFEGFIKPTAKAIPKVIGATAGSLALMPGAGIRAALELIPKVSTDPDKLIEPGSIDKAGQVFNQIMEVPGKLIATPEEAKAVENIGLATKPFEMAGKGWAMIGNAVNKGLRELGLPADTYLEPLLGAYGEASAIFALPGVVKGIKNSNFYRRMAIPERGLIVQSLAETVKKNPNMTEGEILRTFKNPQWREEALKARSLRTERQVKPVVPAQETPPVNQREANLQKALEVDRKISETGTVSEAEASDFQPSFEMAFEGKEYRNLGDATTTSGEQLGQWQVKGKNDRWITLRSAKRIRILDNAKDKIANAERAGREIEETGRQAGPGGQAAPEARGVGEGGERQIRLRGTEEGGLETGRIAPTATFAGFQEDAKGNKIPLYQIEGGPLDKSTVTQGTLEEQGIEVPETLEKSSVKEWPGDAETKLSLSEFTVKPPKKLYRGTSQGKGTGIYSMGKGLYSTPDKSFAKKYGGDIIELTPQEAYPRNPLVLRNVAGGAPGALTDWILQNSGFRNIREFNKAYPDPGAFIREKGYDGIIAGDEVVRYFEETKLSIKPAVTITPRAAEDLDEIKTLIDKTLRERLSENDYNRTEVLLEPLIKVTDEWKGISKSAKEHGGLEGKTVMGYVTVKDLYNLMGISYNFDNDTIQRSTLHEVFHIYFNKIPKSHQNLLIEKYGNEEKAADAWSMYAQGEMKTPPKGMVRRIFNRLVRFFQGIRDALTGKGYTSTDMVFERIFGKKYRDVVTRAGVDLSLAGERLKTDIQKTEKIIPQKYLNIEDTTKSKIAFTPRRIDLSKEGIKDMASKVYTTFFMSEYPIKRLASKVGPEVEKTIEEQIRRVRGTGGITEAILTANSKTPFIELAKDGISEYSHLGDTSLQRILKPIDSKDLFRDYERIREAERDLAFWKYRKDDIKTGKLKGIDPENSNKVIELLKEKYGDDGFKKLQNISRQHTRFEQDAVLKTLLKSGWMSQEKYDAIMDRPESEFYASYLREMEDVDRETVGGGGDPVKRIYGSEKRKLPSTEGTIGNILRTVRLVEKNRLNKQIVAMRELSPDLKEIIVERKPRFQATEITFPKRDAQNRFIKDKDGNRIYQTKKVAVPVGPPKDTITVAEGGTKKYYELPNDVLNALEHYNAREMNAVFRLMSVPSRLLRAGATLSAEFIMRNPARDQLTAYVYSKYGYNPFTDFAKGLFHAIRKDDLYKEFKAAGGENSYFVSLDRHAVNLTARDISGMGNKIKYVKNPVEALRILSEFSEKGTRVGLYGKAKAKGATTQEAMTEAREGTLDFGRTGQERTLNQIIAFWNASLQGTDKLFREMKNPRAIMKAVMGITLPSIGLWLINHDKERYKQLPAWRKNFFWNIIIEGMPIISIPKPFELGLIFGSLPERILDWTVLNDPEAIKDIAVAAGEGITPSVLPTAMLPFIEHMANYSFFRGQRLEPKSFENIPEWMHYGQYTTEIAKKTGKLINVSPIKIENWVRNWTGTLGSGALAGFDQVFMGDDAPDVGKNWYEVAPGVKGFISREPIGSGSKSVDLFYENVKKALAAEAGYKFLNKHQNQKEAQKYAKEERDSISIAKAARREMMNMTEIRKNINSIIDSRTMTPDKKREKIDKLNRMITSRAKSFNQIFENMTREKRP